MLETELEKYIKALQQCAKEHVEDVTSTFNIRVADLCTDTATMLGSILADLKEELDKGNDNSNRYDKGLADAWDLARKLDTMSIDTVRKIFNTDTPLHTFKPQEVKEMLDKYENDTKIKVGDVVEDAAGHRMVVTRVRNLGPYGYISGISKKGEYCDRDACYWHKTGIRFDTVEGMLSEL